MRLAGNGAGFRKGRAGTALAQSEPDGAERETGKEDTMHHSNGLDRGRNQGRWIRPDGGGSCYVLGCASQGAPAAAGPHTRPLRVLVADGEEGIRRTLALHLRQRGCETGEAESGLGALRMLADRRYDIVILGLHMSGMDGFDTASFVLKHWPADILPKLVALVPEGDRAERERCLSAGFVDVAAKPFRAADLDRILASG